MNAALTDLARCELYALEPGVGYLARALDSVARLRDDHDRKPAAGSQLERELAAVTGRRRQHLLDATTIAWIRLVAAEEHLRAMTVLIPREQSLYSVYSLARTTSEIAARACWLLDPAVSGAGRAERGLEERRYSLQQIQGLGFSAAKEQGAERLRKLQREAQAEGLTVGRANRRRSATTLMADIIGHDGPLGPVIYRLLSAFTHGTTYALHQLVHRDTMRPSETDGLMEIQLGTDAGTEAQVLLMAVLPWRAALEAQCRLYGWNDTNLQAELVYGAAEIRRVMMEHVSPALLDDD